MINVSCGFSKEMLGKDEVRGPTSLKTLINISYQALKIAMQSCISTEAKRTQRYTTASRLIPCTPVDGLFTTECKVTMRLAMLNALIHK